MFFCPHLPCVLPTDLPAMNLTLNRNQRGEAEPLVLMAENRLLRAEQYIEAYGTWVEGSQTT